ncbi:MAG: DUF5060 domain-containing protein [Prolixibacteraceae bacterium]|nr:DUF5060 domain-containing protein [Prolixibacteraceae bacterium]
MDKLKISIVATFLLLLTMNLQAQILKTECLNAKVYQYQKAEWQIELKSDWTNPYNAPEIALDMQITSPSGIKLTLPCFYESGKSSEVSVWKARFTAREAGVYSYYFELKKKGKVVSANAKAEFKVKASEGKGFLNPNDLWTFKYDNGELFRGIGENICWESRDEDDSKYFENLHEDKRFNYDFMLKKLAASDGNFFRVWMIYWNLPVDWKTVSNNSRYQNTTSPYNESGMKRMDWLVNLCDSLGIHMMVALESHVGFMGDGWNMSSYNVANGGPAKTPLEFFTLPEARAQYKNKLRLMVARYGYSPSVAAWEFFNEIDNAMYAGKPEDRIPDEVITGWHDEMSTYLKAIDPYQHMVTTSISHRDVAGMNDLKNIDINQKHIYKNTAGIPETIPSYTQKHNKPYVIGESGYEWDWSKNFNDFADDMDGDFKRGLWLGLFNPTPVLPMSWWWEFFENRGMMSYFKPVSEINRMMLEAGKGKFDLFEVKTNRDGIQAYGVRCGKMSFVYLYNSGESCTGIQLSGIEKPNAKARLSRFVCETGKYYNLKCSFLPDNGLKIEQLELSPKSNTILIVE